MRNAANILNLNLHWTVCCMCEQRYVSVNRQPWSIWMPLRKDEIDYGNAHASCVKWSFKTGESALLQTVSIRLSSFTPKQNPFAFHSIRYKSILPAQKRDAINSHVFIFVINRRQSCLFAFCIGIGHSSPQSCFKYDVRLSLKISRTLRFHSKNFRRIVNCECVWRI